MTLKKIGTVTIRQDKVLVFERFVRQPNGRYRLFVRYGDSLKWLPKDGVYDRLPYTTLGTP